jgi:XrtJ-associated TM-motif-TM protein
MKTMRLRTVIIFLFAIAGSAVAAHAQTGCLDSPENPTAVLGLVGAAAGAIAYARAKISTRK